MFVHSIRNGCIIYGAVVGLREFHQWNVKITLINSNKMKFIIWKTNFIRFLFFFGFLFLEWNHFAMQFVAFEFEKKIRKIRNGVARAKHAFGTRTGPSLLNGLRGSFIHSLYTKINSFVQFLKKFNYFINYQINLDEKDNFFTFFSSSFSRLFWVLFILNNHQLVFIINLKIGNIS